MLLPHRIQKWLHRLLDVKFQHPPLTPLTENGLLCADVTSNLFSCMDVLNSAFVGSDIVRVAS